MPVENLYVQIAGANLTLGADMLSGHRDARTPEPRVITGLSLTGSAAAGDMTIDLYVNRQRRGTYNNTSTGLVRDMDKDFVALDTFVPANALIEAIITDAGGTNPAVLQIEFGPPASNGRRSFRRSTRRSYTPRTGARRSFSRPAGGMY